MLEPSPIIYSAGFHPFSASAKSTVPPPDFELRRRDFPLPKDERRPYSPPASPPSASDFSSTTSPVTSINNNEELIWERALAKAIDHAEGKVDLFGKGLSYIPSSIGDLSKLVVLESPGSATPSIRSSAIRSFSLGPRLPFGRVASEPAAAILHRTWTRTSTAAPSHLSRSVGHRQSRSVDNALQIYVGKNFISVLPKELFGLTNLVVLSLRDNQLTYLPPAIGRLLQLRELNLFNNRLTFLPSEILNLKLSELMLTSNRFVECPKDIAPHPERNTFLSPIILTIPDGLPPLTEICMRKLLTPPTARRPTPLEERYDPIIQGEWPLLDRYLERLTASTKWPPYSAQGHSDPRITDACLDITASSCPAPHHYEFRGKIGVGPRFDQHAEERYEWRSNIAGCDVRGAIGGVVPVRWRGCTRGCLAWLDPPLPSLPPKDLMEIEEEGEVNTLVEGDDDDMFGFGS